MKDHSNLPCSENIIMPPDNTEDAGATKTATELPSNIKELFKSYLNEAGNLLKLPDDFTLEHSTNLHYTSCGAPISYKHNKTARISLLKPTSGTVD